MKPAKTDSEISAVWLDEEIRESVQGVIVEWLSKCRDRGIKIRVARQVAAKTILQIGEALSSGSFLGGDAEARQTTASDRIEEVIARKEMMKNIPRRKP